MKPAMTKAKWVLLAALLALVALYVAWFGFEPEPWAELVVFALPPLLLAIGVAAGRRTAGFWSAVLALAWFSHGIVVAWERPDDRLLAWVEIVLALVVVFAASLPGMKARFGRRRGADGRSL